MRTFGAFAFVAVMLLGLAAMLSDAGDHDLPPTNTTTSPPELVIGPEYTEPPEEPETPEVTSEQSAESHALKITGALSHGMIPTASFDELYADVRVQAIDTPPEIRPPLNVALVVDRSGSMNGEAMVRAREAARTFVDSLNEKDRITLVAFDYASSILVGSTAVDEEGKRSLHRAIDNLNTGGTTNLSGGLQDGFEEVERFAEPEMVNRVVLMTDGVPNVGITDADGLAGRARTIRQSGVTVTTLGFGTMYDSSLMAKMAEEGAGNFRHITNPGDLELAFADELADLQNTIASGVQLEFHTADGVEIEEIYGFSEDEIAGGARITLGNLQAEARRSAVVRLKVDAGVEGSVRELIDVRARYVDRLVDSPVAVDIGLGAQVVASDAEVEESIDTRIIARVEQVRTQDSIERAMELYASGDQVQAQKQLRDERQRVRSARSRYNIDADAEEAQDLDRVFDSADHTVQNYAPSSPQGRSGTAEAAEDSIQLYQGR